MGSLPGLGRLLLKCNWLQIASYPVKNVITNVTIPITLSKYCNLWHLITFDWQKRACAKSNKRTNKKQCSKFERILLNEWSRSWWWKDAKQHNECYILHISFALEFFLFNYVHITWVPLDNNVIINVMSMWSVWLWLEVCWHTHLSVSIADGLCQRAPALGVLHLHRGIVCQQQVGTLWRNESRKSDSRYRDTSVLQSQRTLQYTYITTYVWRQPQIHLV